MKTYMANAANVQKNWVVVDVDGMTFGRAASQVAAILMGKNKPEYTPNVDTGDYVIALNVAKLTFTGKKLDQKYYYHHSGYPGGLKEVSYRHMMERKPEFLFKEAVRRMLPKNKLGDKMLTKLHVYAGAEHNHQAQCPVKVEL